MGKVAQVLTLERLAAELRHRGLLSQALGELALAGLERRLGALAVGDVLAGAQHFGRRAVRAQHHLSAREHHPLIPAGLHEAMLERERSTGRERMVHECLNVRAVVGMHELQVGVKAVLRANLHPVDPAQLIRPRHGIGADLPFPAADRRDPLRLGKPRLASSDALLGRDRVSDIARERGRADDRAHLVSNRGHRDRNVDASASLGDALRPNLADDLAGTHALEEARLRLALRRHEHDDGGAEHLSGRIAIETLGRRIPVGDDAVEREPDDRVPGEFDERGTTRIGVNHPSCPQRAAR